MTDQEEEKVAVEGEEKKAKKDKKNSDFGQALRIRVSPIPRKERTK